MLDLGLIFVAAVLVNNFVLTQFLGLCPFVGVTGRLDNALAMGAATAFVLTLSAAVTHLLEHLVLVPLGLEYLRVLTFIVIIASLVQLTQVTVRAISPLLHQVLGIYLPLITTNCAVLGVALLSLGQGFDFVDTLVYAFGASIGFTLVMVVFAAMREQLVEAQLPVAFRGAPIVLLSAGLLSLAFMGFRGIGS
ncbi:MAG: electron transport complex subunit RsxA [Gammaproteobacteria bacterium]|nr:MAG: electron transport complex subunit RsxA [Gammaproteobacteria bacterium]